MKDEEKRFTVLRIRQENEGGGLGREHGIKMRQKNKTRWCGRKMMHDDAVLSLWRRGKKMRQKNEAAG